MPAIGPDFLYRRFRRLHCVEENGRWRIASSLFKTPNASYDDGAVVRPRETATRGGRNEGAVSIPKSKFVQLGLAVVPDEEGHHPGHRIVSGSVPPSKCKRLAMASSVVVSSPDLPELEVDH